jgi:hypothetical protein
MIHRYGLTSGTDSFVDNNRNNTFTININPDNSYYTYSRAFDKVEEFEFVEKKRKPHHAKKKKGWEI